MALAESTAETGIVEEDVLRADLYDMLAALLARPPSPELLTMVKDLSGDSTPLGQGISAMARLAGHIKAPAVETEFNYPGDAGQAVRTDHLEIVRRAEERIPERFADELGRLPFLDAHQR